jgi:hypothetical protein
MKISNKKTVLGALLLALIFSFTGCKDASPADVADLTQKDALAKLVVNVNGAARTLAPDAADLKYRLVLTTDSDSTVKREADVTGSTITQELEPGRWTVGVLAWTGENLHIGWQESSVTLAAGETKDVTLVVEPLTDEGAPATFKWNFVLPEEEGLETWIYTQTLTPSDSNSSIPNPLTLEKKSGSEEESGTLELPAGRYILDVEVRSDRVINGSALKAVRKEVVYLYPRLTTEAAWTFTAADFGAEVYFSGNAAVYYQTGASGYTPTLVELKLATSEDEPVKVKSAPITLNRGEDAEDESDDFYEWELSEASNAIANNLSSAQFRFKATASGDRVLYSPWHSVSVGVTGKTGIDLIANVYKINAPELLTGGSIKFNPEGASGDLVRLTVEPTAGYGLDQSGLGLINENNTTVANATNFTRVEGVTGIQYDFVMPGQDVTPTVSFFRLQGTVYLGGDNTAGYKPIKIEAFEVGEDYESLKIGETTAIAAETENYRWRIALNSYVYANSANRYVIFRITLQAGSVSYPFTEQAYISDLYGESNKQLYVPINQVSNVSVKTSTDSSIELEWDQAAWAVGGYKVERSNDNVTYAQVGAVIPLDNTKTKASYTNPGLQSAYTYYYRVVGLLAGGVEGNPSTLVSARTRYQTPTYVNAGFNGGYPSLRSYVSWNAVTSGQNGNPVYYYVYRDDEKIASIWDNNSYYTYTDNSGDLDFGKTYRYTVVAWGYDGGDSAQSAPAVITTPDITYISADSDYTSSISSGESKYYRVNDAQSWYRGLFSLNYTNADIYVEVYTASGSYITGNTYYAGRTNASVSFYSNNEPLIIIVRGNGGSGSYSFNVQQW